MTRVVGWKISSSYWLDESRCVVLVGWLIWDFVSMELCWRRNSTGRVADCPLGERNSVAWRVKTEVVYSWSVATDL